MNNLGICVMGIISLSFCILSTIGTAKIYAKKEKLAAAIYLGMATINFLFVINAIWFMLGGK